MSIKNKNYDGVKLYPKRNGQNRISSYSLNISTKEARKLNFVNTQCSSYNLKKEIIDNKLIISRAFANEKVVKLSKKKTKNYISSYNLSISCKEARALSLIDEVRTEYGFVFTHSFIATKEITDDKLVVSRAFPQSRCRFSFINRRFWLNW